MGKLSYALFGGSFDPPHLGHRAIIEKSLKVVDRVIIVPTFLNPFKSSFNLSPSARLEIVEDAFSDIDGVIVSNFEVKNSRATFTVETYLELSKKYNINHIIVGADNLETLSKWRDFDFLNSRVTWIIAKRGEKDIECSLLKRCILLDIDVDVSSSEIRDGKKLHLIDKKIQKRVRDEYRIREKS